MKNFKFLFAGLFLLFVLNVNGQLKIGGTLGLQMPTGDFGDAADTGFGINAVGKYFLSDQMAVGLNVGYGTFSTELDDLKFFNIPVTGLFEYHFGKPESTVIPYLGGDLGLYSLGSKYDGESDSEMYFGFAPAVGINYPLSDLLSLNANLKYHVVLSEGDATTYMGLNVGLIYTIK